MKEKLKTINNKPNLLLHCCCAPCTSAVLERLKDFFNITLYYYNPNIMPKCEWIKRKKEFKKLKAICKFNFIAPAYSNNQFIKLSNGLQFELEGGLRCKKCLTERITKTFKYAQKHNFPFFCSTLSISPHKDCEFINKVGSSLENNKVSWLTNDFKKENGFKRSIELSNNLHLYRQNYCGCLFKKIISKS